ncbi:MAG: hypothetical protein ACTTKD_07670 [Peptoanaerobacter stomatis]|uniref:hypothetical protein n=1 Tax=Peptoanaerobacter stomatis TaxID=796937 RepID=UPI003FA04428
MATKKENIKEIGNEKYKCSCCGSEYDTQKGLFLTGNPFLYKSNNKYMQICTNCINKYFEKLLTKTDNNYYVAFKTVCGVTDTYYASSVVDTLTASKKLKTTFSSYIKLLNLSQYRTKTFFDSVIEDTDNYFKGLQIQQELDNFKFKKFQEEENEIVAELETINKLYNEFSKGRSLELFWGLDYTKQEYVLLESAFQEYISEYECNTKAEEDLFKTLCQIKFEADKVRKSDINKYKQLIELWQKTMESANIKPNQKNANDLTDKQTLGTLIKQWEDTRPVPAPQKRWADIDKIGKLVRVWFLGNLCKMVGADNKYSQEYDEEMEKYTVKENSDVFAEDEKNISNLDEMFGEF